MKIRSQISFYLAPFILIVITGVFGLNYYFVREQLIENAQRELAKHEQNIHRASQALLSSAIANYLRGITEKNIDFIDEQYALFQMGRLTEGEAKAQIQQFFDLQGVGQSGYLVAVKEYSGKLYLDLHPYLPRQECTGTEGCRVWADVRNGYVEYDWKNPADNSFRKKAAYVVEYPQWGWIVGASSYRDEFVNLVKIDDLKKLIAPIRINESGYFFVFDESYRLLIHPEHENKDARSLTNSAGERVIETIRNNEGRFTTYLWENPSVGEEQQKYAIAKKLDGYNWYLVATGYLSEAYEPLERLKPLSIFLGILACMAMLVIILRVSRNLTQPLQRLEERVNLFYRDKQPMQWEGHSIHEVDVLGKALAEMSSELERSLAELREKNNQLALSEKEKSESRTLLDSIINSMPSVIIGVDPDLTITQWNRKAEESTGAKFEHVSGRSLFEVYQGLEGLRGPIEECIAGTTVTTLMHHVEGKAEEDNYSEVTVFPLVTRGLEGAVIRIDEVTSRVEMEARLRQSQKMDAVGQLAGGIAHDFNNMLSGIVGAAELLRIKADPEQQKLVKIIRESSGRAGELIQKLLAFSRKENVPFKPLDMHVVIGDTIEILNRTLDKRISIKHELKADASIIEGDWSQLQNSLLNLGINAGHAMPTGGELNFTTVAVNLDKEYCENSTFNLDAGEFLQISIYDTGCGIDPDTLKHIFEPFFTTRSQAKGTGLGLAAVYGAVQQHHGAVFVSSQVGKGTEFRLLLPLSEQREVDPSVRAELVHGEGCILLIDDEPMVRTTAKLMLERLGYRVVEAENGYEGVEMYRQHGKDIDIVVLDMLMPVMDGTECFTQLKKVNPDVRVIVSSGFTRDADLGALKEQGLCNFIRKPFSINEISEVVARAIHER